jgi:hypothetical protein
MATRLHSLNAGVEEPMQVTGNRALSPCERLVLERFVGWSLLGKSMVIWPVALGLPSAFTGPLTAKTGVRVP